MPTWRSANPGALILIVPGEVAPHGSCHEHKGVERRAKAGVARHPRVLCHKLARNGSIERDGVRRARFGRMSRSRGDRLAAPNRKASLKLYGVRCAFGCRGDKNAGPRRLPRPPGAGRPPAHCHLGLWALFRFP
jgi:hypothetical protein